MLYREIIYLGLFKELRCDGAASNLRWWVNELQRIWKEVAD